METKSNSRAWARGFSLLMLVGGVAAFGEDALASGSDRLGERYMPDVNDLRGLRAQAPGAADSLIEGEALLAQGAPAKALKLFQKALEAAPRNPLVVRRHCQALTELGRRADAVEACKRALSIRPSPMAMRAVVAALMLGPPTTEEVALALNFAEEMRRTIPNEPWGYAAQCDVARALGERIMLTNCVNDLERVAPGHFETERARALLGSSEPSKWFWVAWAGIGLSILFTLVRFAAHALSRFRRLAPKLPMALSLSALILLQAPAVLGEGSAASAPGGFSKWPVNDADPKASLPTPAQRDSDPLNFGYHMMDLSDRAGVAVEKGDFARAARYFEAMVVAVPDSAVGYRKACELHDKAGDRGQALGFCRGALGVPGVMLSDFTRYVELVVSQPGPLSKEQQGDIAEILKNLSATPGNELAVAQIECDLSVRLEDAKRLERCSSLISKAAPKAAKTLAYQWQLALLRQDYTKADLLARSATQFAVAPEVAQRMVEQVKAEQSLMGRLRRAWRIQAVRLGSGALLAAGALAGAFLLFRQRRLQRWLERLIPRANHGPTP